LNEHFHLSENAFTPQTRPQEMNMFGLVGVFASTFISLLPAYYQDRDSLSVCSFVSVTGKYADPMALCGEGFGLHSKLNCFICRFEERLSSKGSRSVWGDIRQNFL